MTTKGYFKTEKQLLKGLDAVDKMLTENKAGLDLDFANLEFMSVDGLEWLEELLLRAESLNKEVKILNVPPSIYKVFKVARIDIIFKACDAATTSGPVC